MRVVSKAVLQGHIDSLFPQPSSRLRRKVDYLNCGKSDVAEEGAAGGGRCTCLKAWPKSKSGLHVSVIASGHSTKDQMHALHPGTAADLRQHPYR